MAASAEPMANVRAIVWLTLMPISSAAPRSSDTARMALPIFVRPVNCVSATMMTILASTVTIVSPLMSSAPSNREMEPMLTTEAKLLGFGPQMSSARFCKR